MRYYGNPRLDEVKELVDAEIREGTRSLRASYLSRKYHVEPSLIQQVLSDLVATRDLKVSYELLCSGEHQNYDIDREYDSPSEIPRHEITCSKCGDHYVPAEDNIIVLFEPTDSYVESLTQRRSA